MASWVWLIPASLLLEQHLFLTTWWVRAWYPRISSLSTWARKSGLAGHLSGKGFSANLPWKHESFTWYPSSSMFPREVKNAIQTNCKDDLTPVVTWERTRTKFESSLSTLKIKEWAYTCAHKSSGATDCRLCSTASTKRAVLLKLFKEKELFLTKIFHFGTFTADRLTSKRLSCYISKPKQVLCKMKTEHNEWPKRLNMSLRRGWGQLPSVPVQENSLEPLVCGAAISNNSNIELLKKRGREHQQQQGDLYWRHRLGVGSDQI